MNDFEYYLKTDPKYHDEVYELLEILAQDVGDAELEEQQAQAKLNLGELVKLSENSKE